MISNQKSIRFIDMFRMIYMALLIVGLWQYASGYTYFNLLMGKDLSSLAIIFRLLLSALSLMVIFNYRLRISLLTLIGLFAVYETVFAYQFNHYSTNIALPILLILYFSNEETSDLDFAKSIRTLLAIAYFCSGLSKLYLSGLNWLNGDALQAYLVEGNVASPSTLLQNLIDKPNFLSFVSIFILIWEFSFILSISSKKLISYFYFVTGLLFHFIIYKILGPNFFLFFVPAYLAFFPNILDKQKIQRWLSSKWFALVSMIAVAYFTALFNRIIVQTTWSLLKIDESVFSTGWNLALLAPLYFVIFHFLKNPLQKYIQYLNETLSSSDAIRWSLPKLLFTPLELVAAHATIKGPSYLFFLTGAAQMTLGSIFLLWQFSNLLFFHLAIAYAIQTVFFLAIIKILPINFQNEEAKPYTDAVFFKTCLSLPILFLSVGFAGQQIYLLFEQQMVNAVESVLTALTVSTGDAHALAQIWVQRWFLTERAVFFHFAAVSNFASQSYYWPSLISSLNFFNIFSCALVFLLIFIYTNIPIMQKIKFSFYMAGLAFLVAHIPGLLFAIF